MQNLTTELTNIITEHLTIENPGSSTSFTCGKITGIALATFKDNKPYVSIFLSLNNNVTHRNVHPIHDETLKNTQDLKHWIFYNKPLLKEFITKEILQLYTNILPF